MSLMPTVPISVVPTLHGHLQGRRGDPGPTLRAIVRVIWNAVVGLSSVGTGTVSPGFYLRRGVNVEYHREGYANRKVLFPLRPHLVEN